jgi:hypothetical protein
LNNGGWVGREGVRESNGRGEPAKVKYTHSGVHRETPVNTDVGINNERQDCKIGTVCIEGCLRGGRIKGGDKGERIWLMGFIYIYEIEQ